MCFYYYVVPCAVLVSTDPEDWHIVEGFDSPPTHRGWKFLAMGMICKGTWELSDLGAYSW